jgi:hypothetical protein
MRIVWLLALAACLLLTGLFYWMLLYYFLDYTVTWRVIAGISVAVFWTLLTRQVFLKVKGESQVDHHQTAKSQEPKAKSE